MINFGGMWVPGLSICILRLSSLGDVTHVLPLINAINNNNPQAKITWLIGKTEAELLKDVAGIEFVVVNKQGGFQAMRQLRQTLRGRRFDTLLHLQATTRANLLSTLIKAPVRIGWDKPRQREGHRWFINNSIRSVPGQHQVDAFLEFARVLDVPTGSPEWKLPVSAADMTWANQVLGDGPPILMINPCSRRPLRNWHPSRYAELADYAISKLKLRVVLTGGSSEMESRTGCEIESAMQNKPQNLIGKDTISQSVALMKHAAVVLSPDSAPVHLASAIGTPVIGLYAATPSQRSGPYSSLGYCVDKYAEAARKFKNKEPQDLRWGQRIEYPGVMDLIETRDVVEKLEALARTLNRHW